ncbi:hypothetical protein Tco_0612658 [Tanacetum coccineum]
MSVRLADRSFQYPVGIAENMLVEVEEDFDALLDEGSKILHSIEGTLLEEEIFSEFDVIIEHLAKDGEKDVFRIITKSLRKSLILTSIRCIILEAYVVSKDFEELKTIA